jgi:predicted nucleic acid-binding Zn ribbon protein
MRGMRRIGDALAPVRTEAAPATLLAAVQELWPRAAGDAVAAEAEPVAEREGVVTVACRSATWAQELDLLQSELLERLRDGLVERGFEGRLEALRFTADAARHDD